MIDALFGSKTRVKLLHLFLNNPGQQFYVREITRKIDEQINSVRRELANMIEIGIVTSDSAENKLYYQVNQRYDYYLPLKAIFSDSVSESYSVAMTQPQDSKHEYVSKLKDIAGVRLAIFAGVLVKGSSTPVDVLLVGSPAAAKVTSLIKMIENSEQREINYTVMSYDEFYYRLSVRDRFIMGIINSKHSVMIDEDKILEQEEK